MYLALLLCTLSAVLWNSNAVDYACKNGETTAINVFSNESAWFQTANFPNPSAVPSPSCRFLFNAPAGYSVKLLFEQFFTNSHDQLQFCRTPQTQPIFCKTLSGNPLDVNQEDLVYNGLPQFYGTFSSKLPTASQSPPDINSGFRGKAVLFKDSEDALCSPITNIQLNNGESDIITSPAYPKVYSTNLDCNYTITATDHFRLVFNEFKAMRADKLTIYDASGNVFYVLSGWETFDGPITLTMEKFAKLRFQTSSTPPNNLMHGFYLRINAYSNSGATNSCPTSGDYDLVALGDTGLKISTPGFGSSAYPNSLVCKWTVKNEKASSVIIMLLWLETEHCCDMLEVRDMINQTFHFRGKQAEFNLLSYAKQLVLNFSSDSVLASTGFQATIKAVDCSCDLMKEIDLDSNTPSASINSPGFSAGVGYCNRLQCGWTIRAQAAKLIQISISISALQLRSSPGNTLTIQDELGHTIANYTSQSNSDSSLPVIYITGSIVRITFTSDQYFPSGEVARGFALTATMTSPTPTVQVSQSFTDASFALPIERITDANTNYIGMWTARARSGRRVRFYNFAASNPNAQLLLYDGPDMTSAIINNSQASSNPPFGKVTPLVSSGEFMTVVYSSQSSGGTVRFAALLSDYEDDSYESRCGGFAYVHYSSSSSVVQLEQESQDANQQCLNVLYEFRDTGTPSFTDAIQFNFQNTGSSLSVFRGITIDSQFLIANSQPYPVDIYGTYITVQFGGKISLSFNFHSLSTQPYPMSADSGIIMSPDYKATSCPQVIQTYLWNGMENGLVFNLETHLYSGTLDIKSSLYTDDQKPITVNSNNDKRTINICGTYVFITYNSNKENGTGFLASYHQSTTDLCKSASMLKCTYLLPLFALFLLYHRS